MKRLLLLAVFILGINILLNAQKGIRIESRDVPVIVYIDNSQMCTPVHSCFISNLNRGVYLIEVYTETEHRNRRAKPIYSERINYKGVGIEEINIDAGGNRPHPSHPGNSSRIMNERGFGEFYSTIKEASFDDTKLKLISSTLATTDYTCEQAKELSLLYSFDNKKVDFMKLIYPNIVDKANFFMVINTLTFDSNKNTIAKFIEESNK